MKRFAIFLLLGLLLFGCSAPPAPSASGSPSISPQPSATSQAPDTGSQVSASEVASALASALASATPTTQASTPASGQAQAPTATPAATPSPAADTTLIAGINPYHPDDGVRFTLNVMAEDDAGIASIYWETEDVFSVRPDSPAFDCKGTQSCKADWTFAAPTEGYKTIRVYSVNTAGLASEKKAVVVPVGGSAPVLSTPTPEAQATPNIQPSATAQVDDHCSSNSECGYKKICRSGKCISVQCTNDGQCSSHRRCSGYSCVLCPMGPYGRTC